jgi:hypothetical protein
MYYKLLTKLFRKEKRKRYETDTHILRKFRTG